MRKIKIIGMGKYLPGKAVLSSEIDKRLGLSDGWTEKKSGVYKRYYANGETASEMGAKAAQKALEDAGLTLEGIDCIVSASGTMEQPIPCTASLIHEKLKPKRPIPAFDINSTCLSFVTALDTMSYLVDSGKYRHVLLVSSDIASIGINPMQKESYVLFGDAAVACVIRRSSDGEESKIRASLMYTHSEGARFTEIRGGGTHLHPNDHSVKEDFLFDMDGKAIFRLSSKVINGFMDELLDQASLSTEEIDWLVPHQASGMAMRILAGKIGFESRKMVNVIKNYGNTIAASIPLALHDAIQNNQIRRGQKVLLLGTSAGLSLGGLIIEY
ncbi:beta-ketoacyl-ACP synthase III [Heyndrickxia oleronia]|uniref:3-oxoacyl-ACP synthase n=1 Tax=Heyndrickxia oleronia TaxID=38875 RepID=A0A8E2IFR9_9BACI|nr:beta-ketoacyl-ACP synthase III [Heyndrickxia oleronia]MEC1377114.1 beta-ketoacyl-ACP synthase III [Heyndrickxia oleronia]OOP69121.1 3-oxoacyl-ACP synthase [Heyndrickxia oleronia]QQZ05808.1 beta-ketoacyl-ACP synthase III [Heyndrickxia oleronia]